MILKAQNYGNYIRFIIHHELWTLMKIMMTFEGLFRKDVQGKLTKTKLKNF